MGASRQFCATLVLLLAACGPGSAPPSAAKPASVQTTAPAQTSQRLALVPAAVIGAWSFDGSCASKDGMTLRPDGKAALGEGQEGLWGIDSEGRLVLLMQNFEPGDLTNTPQGGAAEFYAFKMRAPDRDALISVDTTAPHPIHAKRCPPA